MPVLACPNGKHVYLDVVCSNCQKTWKKRSDEVRRKLRLGEPLRCKVCSNKRTRVKTREFPKLKDSDWAYLAGFFDGEGCLSISKRCVYFSITQVEPDVLIWIKNITTIGKISVKTRPAENDKWKPCSALRTTNVYEMIWLLRGMQPYLKVKRHLLEKVLAHLRKRVDWKE